MMDFFSHAKDTPSGRVGSKHLKNHLENVGKLFKNGLNFVNISNDQKKDLESIAIYHDLGKYTQYFQDYLFDRPNVDYHLKAHSKFGALCYLSKYFNKNQRTGIIGYWIISRHHSDLDSLISLRGEFVENEFEKESLLFEKKNESIFPFIAKIKEETGIDDLNYLTDKLESPRKYFKEINQILKDSNIRNYFVVNYLYSLLIESDKLDASDTAVYQLVELSPNKVDEDKGKPKQKWDNKLTDFSHFSLNELRNLVRKRVIDNLSNKKMMSYKLFTLTGPTGIGKTLTALDFALKLRSKIRLNEDREAQIIYALPFINIIEQTEAIFRCLFNNNEAKILSHYQYADALEQQEIKGEEDNKDYNQKMMSFDTWQCDIVITTFVQFLQTLIGNKNKLLKKFNHFAGSIIILDEVQTISLQHLPLIGASLYYLSKFLDAKIILMTATKPKIFDLANDIILINEGEKANPLELLGTDEDVAKVFKSFNRTKLSPMIDSTIKDSQEFVEKYFSNLWYADKSCLIVVNTVKLSVDVYRSIKKYFAENNIRNHLHYLSTNILPAERQKLITKICQEIREAKNNKELKPILVSTQSIEAGVDLDFDMAFRDLGPIDSIIQVAGRVNRECNNNFVGTVYIIDFGKCRTIYDPITENTAKNTINHFASTLKEIPEKQFLELVTYYYDNIYRKNEDGFEKSYNIFQSMKNLDYNGSKHSVSEFQVIENGRLTKSVFIESDENAVKAKKMFEKLIQKECSREDFEPYKKEFHQHILAVPNHLNILTQLDELTEGVLYVPIELVEDYYDSETGFIRDEPEYSPITML